MLKQIINWESCYAKKAKWKNVWGIILWRALGLTWDFYIRVKHISIEILIFVRSPFIHTSTVIIYIDTYFSLSIQLTGWKFKTLIVGDNLENSI